MSDDCCPSFHINSTPAADKFSHETGDVCVQIITLTHIYIYLFKQEKEAGAKREKAESRHGVSLYIACWLPGLAREHKQHDADFFFSSSSFSFPVSSSTFSSAILALTRIETIIESSSGNAHHFFFSLSFQVIPISATVNNLLMKTTIFFSLLFPI